LKQFLELLAQEGELNKIHLIAHSMGNRCLAAAVQKVTLPKTCELDQCVLAAPDIDAGVFKRDIVSALMKSVKRLTLYASSRDRALKMSKELHDYPRAGDAGPGIIVLEGMDSIDASRVDTDFLGHSYYGDSPNLIGDLRKIIRNRLPASKRSLRP